MVIKNSSIVTSNTYRNCIILNKDKSNKLQENISQKKLTDKHEISEQKAAAFYSERNSDNLSFSRSCVENRQQNYNGENRSKPVLNERNDENPSNFLRPEVGKPKGFGGDEENRKMRKLESFDSESLSKTGNKKALKPLIDFITIDKTSKVNTKEKLAKFNLGNDMITTLYGTSKSENRSSENKPKYELLTSDSIKERKSTAENNCLNCGYKSNHKPDLKHCDLINSENAIHYSKHFVEEERNPTYGKYLAELQPPNHDVHETPNQTNNSVTEYIIVSKSNLQDDRTQTSPVSPFLIFPLKYDGPFNGVQKLMVPISSPRTDTQSPNLENNAFTRIAPKVFDTVLGDEDIFEIKESSLKDNYALVSGNRVLPLKILKNPWTPSCGLVRGNAIGNSRSQPLNQVNSGSSMKGNCSLTQHFEHESVKRDSLVPYPNENSGGTSDGQIVDFNKQSSKFEKLIPVEDYVSYKKRGERIAINSSSGSDMAEILYGTPASKTSAENRKKFDPPNLESLRITNKPLLTESKCHNTSVKIDESSNAKDCKSLHQNENSGNNRPAHKRKPCGIVPGLSIE
ncbi:hypothetical protein AVEN_270273-1 [Araneus ventricosus]|uniref:Uncharacterized protein n=1 Tax=Araneus ventricosus TaxID=182803 RepID=A0A4Y2P2M2_ARAVE|nr:hypothetical protein AVEN_270273-1 [Araneus ventricosus]